MEYRNIFITLAQDCPVKAGVVPQAYNAKPTIASLQFGLLALAPYTLTPEELSFKVYLLQNGLQVVGEKRRLLWETFFSKPKPCMRASPLSKKYGWGVHINKDGRVAIYCAQSHEYKRYLADDAVKKYVALSTSKKM